MKKFKTNELLSRSEMKEVAGAGYGCGGLCTTLNPEGAQPVPIACQHDWTKGCGCPYGYRGAWISC